MSTVESTRRRIPILPLFFVALMAYFDWITHYQTGTAISIGAAGAIAILFREQLIDRVGLRPFLERIPQWARAILPAIPVLILVLARGQGTSGAGGSVIGASIIVMVVTVGFRKQIDRKLAGFYKKRNKILPRFVRGILVAIVPIFVGFLIVHGSLGDIPAMWGAVTEHAQSPAGRGGQIFLSTILPAATGYLLMADPQDTGGSHVIPAGGLAAWTNPDPAAQPVAHIPEGTPVTIAQQAGAWAMVQTEDGWSGWVDGQRLLEQV